MLRTQAELDRRFDHHKPDEVKQTTMAKMRNHFKELASHITKWCPESREASLALTNLEQAQMWCNAAIARPKSGP